MAAIDHPLCSTCFLLLNLFEDPCAQLLGLVPDSNSWRVATTGGVPDCSPGLLSHPSIMTIAAEDKRRKQQQESKARQPGKDFLSQEQKEKKRLEQYR
jgi:hypothetical protein